MEASLVDLHKDKKHVSSQLLYQSSLQQASQFQSLLLQCWLQIELLRFRRILVLVAASLASEELSFRCLESIASPCCCIIGFRQPPLHGFGQDNLTVDCPSCYTYCHFVGNDDIDHLVGTDHGIAISQPNLRQGYKKDLTLTFKTFQPDPTLNIIQP